MIRLQNTGGLGNQLFIWAAAHNLAREYGVTVRIINVQDGNFRPDRPNEVQKLKQYCNHKIDVKTSYLLGILFRVIDKFGIEKFGLGSLLLNKSGVFSFDNPTDTVKFGRTRPRIVRGYFQRNEYVDHAWDQIFSELNLRFIEANNNLLFSSDNSQVIHIRRGDFIDIKEVNGLLALKFFENNLNLRLKQIVCTDDESYIPHILSCMPGATVLNPANSDVWQTLSIFVNAKEFLGSNSTLSWWGAKIRSKTNMGKSILPNPWTRAELGYDSGLAIPGTESKSALFED
jgi:hypothetical protein